MIAPSSDRPVHIFTVDVEDYFQAGALETRISRAQWEAQPRRIVPTVERLLEMLDRFGAKSTFFCLGWIGDRYPDTVKTFNSLGPIADLCRGMVGVSGFLLLSFPLV